jgi:3-hydroxypropanoate dehydrogenase
MANESRQARDDERALLFTAARTHTAWLAQPVDDDLIRRVFELARWAPTGGNAQPLRIVFVRSPEAKERLRPALAPGNVEKTMTAPVTAILAYDVAWYEKLPELMPFRPGARDHMAAMPEDKREKLVLQSANMQAGYLILAARALGLDCGPMAGFEPAKVDAEFFPDGAWRTVLLINLGYGDPAKTLPRMPRLDFATACRIV